MFIILFEEHRNWNQKHTYQAHSPRSYPYLFFSLSHTHTPPHLTDLNALAEVNGERATPQERAGRLGFSGLICAYLEPVNNAWDVGARGSAGIKWLSARYPSIPGPPGPRRRWASARAPEVTFMLCWANIFQVTFSITLRAAPTRIPQAPYRTRAHTRPTPTLNKLCLKRKWEAPEDRNAGSRRVTPLTNNRSVRSVCQLSVSASPAESEKKQSCQWNLSKTSGLTEQMNKLLDWVLWPFQRSIDFRTGLKFCSCPSVPLYAQTVFSGEKHT